MTETEPLDPKLREQLLALSTATLSSQLVKRGLRHAFIGGIAPVNPRQSRMVGLAYTLRFIPMREDVAVARSVASQENPQRRAIEQIPAGHVLVIDARGVKSCGGLGDILASRLRIRGAEGVITDGAMRDSTELEAIELPIFCAGFAGPPSYAGLMAADTQCAIGCGGVAVFPGDVIVTDRDGAVVLPRALAAEVAADTMEQESIDRFVRAKIDAGSSIVGVYPPNEATLAEYRQHRDGEAATAR